MRYEFYYPLPIHGISIKEVAPQRIMVRHFKTQTEEGKEADND